MAVLIFGNFLQFCDLVCTRVKTKNAKSIGKINNANNSLQCIEKNELPGLGLVFLFCFVCSIADVQKYCFSREECDLDATVNALLRCRILRCFLKNR